MALEDAAVVFAVSLLAGTIAILVGVRLIVDRDAGVGGAAVTALVGAALWAASSAAVGLVEVPDAIPISVSVVGVALMLLVWIAVVNWRYPGGWGSAATIGFVAWIVAVALVSALASVGVVSPEALGVPNF